MPLRCPRTRPVAFRFQLFATPSALVFALRSLFFVTTVRHRSTAPPPASAAAAPPPPSPFPSLFASRVAPATPVRVCRPRGRPPHPRTAWFSCRTRDHPSARPLLFPPTFRSVRVCCLLAPAPTAPRDPSPAQAPALSRFQDFPASFRAHHCACSHDPRVGEPSPALRDPCFPPFPRLFGPSSLFFISYPSHHSLADATKQPSTRRRITAGHDLPLTRRLGAVASRLRPTRRDHRLALGTGGRVRRWLDAVVSPWFHLEALWDPSTARQR